MSLPSLLNPTPPSRYRKYIVISVWSVVGAVVLVVVLFLLFRFHSEDTRVTQFLDRVVAGNFQSAYQMWHKGTGYDYQEFLQDWGTSGYYGPVHSYVVQSTHEPKNASGVVVVVYVSPFSSFPPMDNIAKQQRTKVVRLWVQFSDHSISYAP